MGTGGVCKGGARNWGDPGTILGAVGMELGMQRGRAGGPQGCHRGYWGYWGGGGRGGTRGQRWAVGTMHGAREEGGEMRSQPWGGDGGGTARG